MKYQNPIISGFNPDPCMCRVGDDYYIVNSTFEFFPGVPIYHSKNLINWELINYVLKTDEQVELIGAPASGGIYAPTLRYHDGEFFLTVTNVSTKGNFIVRTKDIRGDWTNPVWVNQGGIDPDLFFDDDGKVYFCSTSFENGQEGISMCEINPYTGEMLTESKMICTGSGGRFAEGPHMYKWNGTYYLMLAEGGTEYGHMETIFRSNSPWGPFEGCPHNPILTHRDTMKEEIKCTGHADIFADHNGNWWIISLGIRPLFLEENRTLLHNLGRETFLAPVTWDDDGWPHVAADGTYDLVMDGPLPGPAPTPVDRNFVADFKEAPSLHWAYIRNPYRDNYCFDTERGVLRLTGTEKILSSADDSPTFVGVRQKEFEVCATAVLSMDMQAGGVAGITAYYNDSYHYDLFLSKKEDGYSVCLGKRVHDIEFVEAEQKISEADTVELRIEADKSWYRFSYRVNGGEFQPLGRGMTAGLCTECTHTMTFTGVFLGMFAVETPAEFQDFCVEIVK